VKAVVLPLYSEGKITKDEYKQVMRVVVPKVYTVKYFAIIRIYGPS